MENRIHPEFRWACERRPSYYRGQRRTVRGARLGPGEKPRMFFLGSLRLMATQFQVRRAEVVDAPDLRALDSSDCFSLRRPIAMRFGRFIATLVQLFRAVF